MSSSLNATAQISVPASVSNNSTTQSPAANLSSHSSSMNPNARHCKPISEMALLLDRLAALGFTEPWHPEFDLMVALEPYHIVKTYQRAMAKVHQVVMHSSVVSKPLAASKPLQVPILPPEYAPKRELSSSELEIVEHLKGFFEQQRELVAVKAHEDAKVLSQSADEYVFPVELTKVNLPQGGCHESSQMTDASPSTMDCNELREEIQLVQDEAESTVEDQAAKRQPRNDFHHLNFYGLRREYPSATPPETSLAILTAPLKPDMHILALDPDENSDLRISALAWLAMRHLDPVVYHGEYEDITAMSSASQREEAARNSTMRAYSAHGTWREAEKRDATLDDFDREFDPPQVTYLNGFDDTKGQPTQKDHWDQVEHAYAQRADKFKARLHQKIIAKDTISARGNSHSGFEHLPSKRSSLSHCILADDEVKEKLIDQLPSLMHDSDEQSSRLSSCLSSRPSTPSSISSYPSSIDEEAQETLGMGMSSFSLSLTNGCNPLQHSNSKPCFYPVQELVDLLATPTDPTETAGEDFMVPLPFASGSYSWTNAELGIPIEPSQFTTLDQEFSLKDLGIPVAGELMVAPKSMEDNSTVHEKHNDTTHEWVKESRDIAETIEVVHESLLSTSEEETIIPDAILPSTSLRPTRVLKVTPSLEADNKAERPNNSRSPSANAESDTRYSFIQDTTHETLITALSFSENFSTDSSSQRPVDDFDYDLQNMPGAFPLGEIDWTATPQEAMTNYKIGFIPGAWPTG